jgi:hypothetical protein
VLSGGYVTNILDLSVQPGDSLQITLPPEAFVDAEGYPLGDDMLSVARLNEGGVSVRHRAVVGAQTLAGVAIGSDSEMGACILVQFQQEFVQTQELEFEIDVYLTVRGQNKGNTTFTIAGRIANPVIYLDGEEDYVDLSDGAVVEATTYIKDITMDLGNGIALQSTLFEGSRYYGIATVEQSDRDAPSLPDYPEVELIYTLHTIGLKREDRDTTMFDISQTYYVYNQDGKYIGTTNKMLPYSAKYYLSSIQIERIDLPDSL